MTYLWIYLAIGGVILFTHLDVIKEVADEENMSDYLILVQLLTVLLWPTLFISAVKRFWWKIR